MNKKKIRTRGKFQFSKYFQEFEDGESVALVSEVSVNKNFPDRLQGRTGIIKGRKGKVYIVDVKDQNKAKQFLIEPIHLKKIKTNQ